MEDEEQIKPYGKRPIWQWIVLYVVIAVVIYGLVYYFILGKKNTYNLTSNTQSGSSYATPTQAMSSPTAAMKQKFSDSSNYQYAYKIFPGTLSATAKQALTGFAMTTKNMPDGSIQVTLTAQKPEYKTQQYIVKTGYSLYFIEMNLRDDNTAENEDMNLHDDSAVVVDSQGYIAQ